mmetsp:Transcript_51987/g.105912  ORF Transcript_51987/g.105912 Transcript_51987/m.105912 type:complete len:324 (+) Transcript_51987:1317-2288(+)
MKGHGQIVTDPGEPEVQTSECGGPFMSPLPRALLPSPKSRQNEPHPVISHSVAVQSQPTKPLAKPHDFAQLPEQYLSAAAVPLQRIVCVLQVQFSQRSFQAQRKSFRNSWQDDVHLPHRSLLQMTRNHAMCAVVFREFAPLVRHRADANSAAGKLQQSSANPFNAKLRSKARSLRFSTNSLPQTGPLELKLDVVEVLLNLHCQRLADPHSKPRTLTRPHSSQQRTRKISQETELRLLRVGAVSVHDHSLCPTVPCSCLRTRGQFWKGHSRLVWRDDVLNPGSCARSARGDMQRGALNEGWREPPACALGGNGAQLRNCATRSS